MTAELAGFRVLVVEDEFFLAEEIADILTQAGAYVVGPITDLAGALAQVQDGGFDLAVLDINLHGETSYPLADDLLILQVPFLFATAYSTCQIPPDYRHLPRIEKPYSARALLAGVAGLILKPTGH